MKRAISCTCLAAAFAVGLSAQTPSTSMAQSDTKTVTVTGCLKAGDAPGSFVLANIKTADKAAAGATATAGATGTAGAAASAPKDASKDLENATATLTGSPAGVTLKDHVGHTVQITGSLAPKSAASATAGANPPAEPAAPSASASKAQPTINVSAFSMVAGTCSM